MTEFEAILNGFKPSDFKQAKNMSDTPELDNSTKKEDVVNADTRIGLTCVSINGPTLYDLTIAFHQYIAQQFVKDFLEKEPNYQKALIMTLLWYRQCTQYNSGQKMPFTVQQACQAVGVIYEI